MTGTAGRKAAGFFRRLRTRSFPNVTAPFTSKNGGQDAGREDSDEPLGQAWSSDSSTEDDLTVDDQRHVRNPSILNFADVGDSPVDEEDY